MDSAGTIVWRRRYDEEAHSRNLQRFWNYYALPVAALAVVVAIFVGVGEAAGVLILFGLFGLMLFVWIWLTGRNERVNPTVVLEGGQLHWAKHSVRVNEIVSFTTYMGEASMTVAHNTTPGGVNATASFGVAKFVLVDGEDVEFRWAELGDEQLDELRSALEQVLPGRWRPAGQLHQG